MISDEFLTEGNDVFGLAVEEANGADEVFESFLAQGQDRLWCVGDRKENAGGLVHPFVRGLCRENHCDQEFKGAGVKEFGFG